MGYQLVKQIKDDSFDPSQLDKYVLLLAIGTKDLQLAVIKVEGNRCLLIEDYALKGVRTVGERLRLIQQLFNTHLFLKGGFWREVKCLIKTYKFALIPEKIFSKEAATHFLALNSKINSEYERAYAYLHKKLNFVSTFAADYRLVNFLEEIYAPKKITLIKQGSAFIEAARHHYASNTDKTLYFLLDNNILHLLVLYMPGVYYYNQLAIKKQSDLYEYTRLINRAIDLEKTRAPIITMSSHVTPLGNLLGPLREQYGSRMLPAKRSSFLNYGDVFDKVPTYAFFDLLGGYLCPAQPLYTL